MENATPRRILAIMTILAGASLPLPALATPSTTFWTVSTANCQAWKTPHVTYDTYFKKGPAAGSQGAPNYPVDTGLTVGFLPSESVQGEIGFDLLLPTEDPLVLNAKLCSPESSVFSGSPAVGLGIYNVGVEHDVTDFNILYGVLQKSISKAGGYVAVGVYHGLNKTLFVNSEDDTVQTGLLAGILSPDIEVGLKGLKKINFAADVQTGKNILGAWGFGASIYFADNVSLLTGPVFFFDESLQPGGSDFLWSAQIDIDIAL